MDCGSNNALEEYYDNQTNLASAQSVSVTTGLDTPNVDAQLASGGSISGTVRNSSGNPISRICVKAYDSDGRRVESDRTGSEGSYKIDRLRTGEYRLRFSDCGDNNVLSEYYDDKNRLAVATPVAVVAGDETPEIDAQLATGGSVFGQVSDSSGNPLTRVCVTAYRSSGRYSGSALTGTDGSYEIVGLTTDNYKIRFRDCGRNNVLGEYFDDKPSRASADPVGVEAGIQTPDIDAQLAEAGSISGRVSNSSGDPLDDICVVAYRENGRRAGSNTTGPDGNYGISRLSAGDYRVRFYDCGDNNVLSEYYEDQPDLASATPIAVALGVDTPDIDAELTTAGSISGTVTDSSGDPLRDICVGASDSTGGYVGSGYTDLNGNYRIGGLTTGDYRIRFYDCGDNNVLGEYYDDQPDLASAIR